MRSALRHYICGSNGSYWKFAGHGEEGLDSDSFPVLECFGELQKHCEIAESAALSVTALQEEISPTSI